MSISATCIHSHTLKNLSILVRLILFLASSLQMLLLFPSMRYKPNPITQEVEQCCDKQDVHYCHWNSKAIGDLSTPAHTGPYFEQHVFLSGSEVHLVLIVINTQVDNVCQQLLVPINHFQLLLQRLACRTEQMNEYSLNHALISLQS